MARATMTSKGQVTVPKEIRDYLGIDAGDRISFEIRDGGGVVLEAETSDVRELKGMLPAPRKAVSVEEMTEAVREGASKR